MEPTEVLAAVNGALAVVNLLVPELDKLVKSGQISPADQQAILDKVQLIRSGQAFSGPHWQVSK